MPFTCTTAGGWIEICDSEVDAESPITQSLMFRLRDNPYDALTQVSTAAPDEWRIQAPERMRTTSNNTALVLGPNGVLGADGRYGFQLRAEAANPEVGIQDGAASHYDMDIPLLGGGSVTHDVGINGVNDEDASGFLRIFGSLFVQDGGANNAHLAQDVFAVRVQGQSTWRIGVLAEVSAATPTATLDGGLGVNFTTWQQTSNTTSQNNNWGFTGGAMTITISSPSDDTVRLTLASSFNIVRFRGYITGAAFGVNV